MTKTRDANGLFSKSAIDRLGVGFVDAPRRTRRTLRAVHQRPRPRPALCPRRPLRLNSWNRMTAIYADNNGEPGALIASYEYDGQNRRIEKVVGENTEDYYWNQEWQLVELRLNSDSDPRDQYVYDIRYVDAPAVRFHDGNTDGDLNDAEDNTLYFTNDANFNNTGIISAAGTVLERYICTPYGQRAVLEANWSTDPDNTSDYGQSLGHQGLMHDGESGLIQNRERYRHTSLGFTSRDTEGYVDGMNLAAFCGGQPTGRTDSYGLNDGDDADYNLWKSMGRRVKKNDPFFCRFGTVVHFDLVQIAARQAIGEWGVGKQMTNVPGYPDVVFTVKDITPTMTYRNLDNWDYVSFVMYFRDLYQVSGADVWLVPTPASGANEIFMMAEIVYGQYRKAISEGLSAIDSAKWQTMTDAVVGAGLPVIGAFRRLARTAPKGPATWANPRTLGDHFARHGKDFGARTAGEYSQAASDFLRNSQAQKFPTKISPDGTIRIYDPTTNTFGQYGAGGETRTFYKPDPSVHGYKTNLDYWNAQAGDSPWTP